LAWRAWVDRSGLEASSLRSHSYTVMVVPRRPPTRLMQGDALAQAAGRQRQHDLSAPRMVLNLLETISLAHLIVSLKATSGVCGPRSMSLSAMSADAGKFRCKRNRSRSYVGCLLLAFRWCSQNLGSRPRTASPSLGWFLQTWASCQWRRRFCLQAHCRPCHRLKRARQSSWTCLGTRNVGQQEMPLPMRFANHV